MRRFFFIIYNLFVFFAQFFAFPFAVLSKTRSFTLKSYLKRLLPKPIESKEKKVLFHFSSVGEINSGKKLIEYFKKKGYKIVITVFTETGYEFAKKIADEVYYLPFDFYFTIKRFLKKIKPSFVLISETEIWPSFIKSASEVSSVLWINARMSLKTFNIYRFFTPLLRYAFCNVKMIFSQSIEDKERFSSFFDTQKIVVCGNTKYDLIEVDEPDDEIKDFFLRWRYDGFTCVFGSIHPDEFDIIARAINLAEDEGLRWRYLIVPRHVEKTNDFEKIAERNNIDFVKYSEIEKGREFYPKIVLFDKIGYLKKLYFFCDIAFVGGTFNNIGGHNLLEPSIYSKPVLFGPNYSNQKTAAEGLIVNGGGFIVRDEYDLKSRIKYFFYDRKKLKEAGERSKKTLFSLQGATERIIKEITSV